MTMYSLTNEGSPKWTFGNIGVYRMEMFDRIAPATRQAWPADPRVRGQEAGRRRSLRRRVAQRRHRAAARPAERAAGHVGAGQQGCAVMDALSPPEAARYASRRARVLAQMPAGAVAVLATAPEVARNSDSDYLYRHDSYFYYLTGFTEPEATLVLVAAQGDAPRAPSCSAARKISNAKSGTATAMARTAHARPSASTPPHHRLAGRRNGRCCPTRQRCTTRWAASSMHAWPAGCRPCAPSRAPASRRPPAPSICCRCWTKCAC
jgi:hypothetical protein